MQINRSLDLIRACACAHPSSPPVSSLASLACHRQPLAGPGALAIKPAQEQFVSPRSMEGHYGCRGHTATSNHIKCHVVVCPSLSTTTEPLDDKAPFFYFFFGGAQQHTNDDHCRKCTRIRERSLRPLVDTRADHPDGDNTFVDARADHPGTASHYLLQGNITTQEKSTKQHIQIGRR
jgi:hypothetical protein